ncbi:MAG: FkbM family methyltransferase [Proteobacteria bacterium]|nr:FkbM family methyltransferase [Pseudomonadota bacterium]
MAQPPTSPDPDPPPWRAKRCRHGILHYLPNDTYIGRSIELYGEFSESEAMLFQQLLTPGAVVVEAGANIGALTLPIANRVGPTGRVIAYEPQAVLAALLVRTVAANALGQVEVRGAALGARPGTIVVPPVDYGSDGNFGGVSLGGADGARVPVETLDALGLARLDLIKIDVEGMEIDVLAGAAATARRLRPTLYVENDRAEHSRALITALADLGYRAWWHFAGLFNPANYFGNSENVFPSVASVNLLCFPREWAMTVTDGIPVLGPDDDWDSARRRARP